MTDVLDIARAAARAGADVLREHAGRIEHIRTKSSASDLVTEVDIASGVAVVSAIAAAVPGARFVVEEPEVYDLAAVTEGALTDSEIWVVDPLDGTTSYVHGYPCYSVSVALLRDGSPVAGAVYNAASGEMNAAAAGRGATLDGRPMRVTDAATIEQSLLVTGFPYDRTVTLDRQLAVFTRMVRRVHGIRRDGSAAIDCCHIAAGRADAFWEFALKTWDTAAGVLIAREAGALVTDFAGRPWSIETADTLVANPVLHAVMLDAIAEYLQAGGFERP
ncbi:MAG: inositol monophosphatase family protein [Coriobacteriia bacterium]|nr:inositol monophosphatase family protein [Coriobacteriia bacterium]